MEFKKILSWFLAEFESYSRCYFLKKIKDSSIYPTLITKFYEDLADFTQGGKRMRAFLVYLGFLIGSGTDAKKILPISLAIELIHTFLLIHDDIIDKSDLRRGKTTIHKRYEKLFGEHYGLSQGIIAGDIVGYEANQLVIGSGFGDELKIKCLREINRVILETAYGEALDIEYSYRKVGIDEILGVADLKTARYSFVGPLTVGAMLGGSGKSQLRALEQFGLKIGLAFQLQDDLLGVFGDEKILGKSTLSDMREGKNTLLIYKAREFAKQADKKTLVKLWGKNSANTQDLEAVKKIIRSCGAYDWCLGEMKRLRNEAVASVDLITRDQHLCRILIEMSDFIVTRRS